MQPHYITNTSRPSFVRTVLGYSHGHHSDGEPHPFRSPTSTPSAIPDYPQTFSSVRHETLSPITDQGTAQFVSEAPSQILEIPYSKAIRKQTGPKKNTKVDPNKKGEEGGKRCVRKRRCGVGRENGYDTGYGFEDTAITFPESRHLLETFGLEARVLYG